MSWSKVFAKNISPELSHTLDQIVAYERVEGELHCTLRNGTKYTITGDKDHVDRAEAELAAQLVGNVNEEEEPLVLPVMNFAAPGKRSKVKSHDPSDDDPLEDQEDEGEEAPLVAPVMNFRKSR